MQPHSVWTMLACSALPLSISTLKGDVMHALTRSAAVLMLILSGSALAHGDLDQRIAALTERMSKEPRNASLYLIRGDLHRLHRAWTLAKHDYDRAAALNPKLPTLEFCRARMALDCHHLSRASKSIAAFRERYPHDVEGLLLHARILAATGRGAESLKLLAEAETRGRARPDLFIAHATLLRTQGRPKEALRVLKQGLQRCSSALSLELAAMNLELRLGRVDDALGRLTRMEQHSQRKDPWLERRATILNRVGRRVEAAKACRCGLRAIDHLPSRLANSKPTQARRTRLRALLHKLLKTQKAST